jgi:hypothetical protein
MRRLLVALGVAAAFAVGARVALAGEPFPDTGRVVISTQGDIVVPPSDRADMVVVVNGSGSIEGEVRTLVVIDGSATIAGAHIENVVAIGSSIEIGDRTLIDGEVMRLDSTVHQSGDVQIAGGITDLAASMLAAWAVLAPALVLIWLGFGLATIVWALLVTALAARQLREAERLLAAEPVQAFLVGLAAVILLPVLAILLMVTMIGAPLGVGLLIVALPLLAFAGYLVAATWIGGWIVRESPDEPAERVRRPFLPIVAGVIVLTIVGLVPVLGIVSAVASLIGFGAVLRLAFRTLRGAARPVAGTTRPVVAPTGA